MATVLVVDDVAANRDLVRMLLTPRGHEVLEAGDGIEALHLAHRHHPDLVISDTLMPGMDGLELVSRLRADPDEQAAQAPVLFYTADYLESESRPIAEASGINQVVLRTADSQVLLDAVDTALADGAVSVDTTPNQQFTEAHVRTVNARLIKRVRELHDTEHLFEAMATASPVGIGLLNAAGDAVYVNPRLAEILEAAPDDLLGQGWLHRVTPETRDRVHRLSRQPGGPAEVRFRDRLDATHRAARWMNVHLRRFRDDELAGTVVMLDDVTDIVVAEQRDRREAERHQQEARTSDAERLDSLHRTARDAAHDFNNILGVILGHSSLASEMIADDTTTGQITAAAGESLLADLKQVVEAAERAKKITERLLRSGRRETTRPAAPDSREPTADAVRLNVKPDPAFLPVRVGRRQLLPTTSEPATGGTGGEGVTVLVVDDEPDLLQITSHYLAKAGYQVLVATSGLDALDLADRHREHIACLITDVVMPGMNGRQLAHQIQARRPAARIVYVSGFAESLIDASGTPLEPGVTIVAKPFTSDQLVTAVRDAVAQHAP
jgi:PAS domain S-box-containing protein